MTLSLRLSTRLSMARRKTCFLLKTQISHFLASQTNTPKHVWSVLRNVKVYVREFSGFFWWKLIMKWPYLYLIHCFLGLGLFRPCQGQDQARAEISTIFSPFYIALLKPSYNSYNNLQNLLVFLCCVDEVVCFYWRLRNDRMISLSLPYVLPSCFVSSLFLILM